MRRVRKFLRKSRSPELFLPVPRGPIHGFYHFFTGYFVPLIKFSAHRGLTKQFVVDCGPFNKWFDLLPGGRPEIVSQAMAIKLACLSSRTGYASGYKITPLIKWDKWGVFKSKKLATIAQDFLTEFESRGLLKGGADLDIVILGRDFTPDYFRENLPSRYGVAKRNIPNLQAIADCLSKHFRVELIDGAKATPAEMVNTCRRASLMIGQHGAALTNLFFMKPGSRVLEIVWNNFGPETHLDMYKQLSLELGIHWRRVALQENRFGEVSCVDLLPIVMRELGRQ